MEKKSAYPRLYKDLIVWQKAMDMTIAVYELTQQFPKEDLFGITNQMRRIAVLIPSGIAIGKCRGNNKEFLNYLRDTYSSASQLETLIEISKRLKRSKASDYKQVDELLVTVMKMLHVMLKKIKPAKSSK